MLHLDIPIIVRDHENIFSDSHKFLYLFSFGMRSCGGRFVSITRNTDYYKRGLFEYLEVWHTPLVELFERFG
jgi:tRNA(Phe) wybutosine-synthesizing methylase Tyw3